jgi:hypothetical protein
MLGSSAASTPTVEATRVTSIDLRRRCIVIKPPCLLSAERDGKSKSAKGECRSEYLTVSTHLDSCRTITFRAAASMHDLALYHFAWISCKNSRAFCTVDISHQYRIENISADCVGTDESSRLKDSELALVPPEDRTVS